MTSRGTSLPGLTRLSGDQLRRALAVGIVVWAGVLVFSWPEQLPGLHVDEAWSFFRAREILGGLRPLDGMNYYTGALHQYLLAGGVRLFGLHVWVAHLLSGAANVGALIAYMQLVRGLHPGKDTWLWVGALTMSSATFVVYSRLSVELSALTPLLVITGVMLVQRSWSVNRQRWACAFVGGLLLGLAVYNHMAAAGAVAGLVLGYLVATGFRCVLDVRSYAALVGLLTGLAPRIVQILQLPDHGPGPAQRLLANLSPNLFADMLYIPELLRGMSDGDLIYHRVAGGCLVAVVPVFTVVLIVACGVRLTIRACMPRRGDVGLLVAVAASAVLVTLISPHLALRYFILPALALPYLLARMCSMPDRVQAAVAGVGVPGWARRLGFGLLLAVIGLQSFYLGVNYFYAHLSTGGRVHVFPLGKHIMEASNGFTRTDRLYARLVDENIVHVVADNLIRWPLEFYDLTPDHLRTTVQPGQRGWRVPKDGPTAIVYYNGPTPIGDVEIEDLRGTERIRLRGREFVLEPGMDENFLVYVHRPALDPPISGATKLGKP